MRVVAFFGESGVFSVNHRGNGLVYWPRHLERVDGLETVRSCGVRVYVYV